MMIRVSQASTRLQPRRGAVNAALMVLPPCLVVVHLFILAGTTPDLAAHFQVQRAASPHLSAALEFLTDWGNFIFYAVYATMLLRGLKQGRSDLVRFALVYLIVQLLISFALVRVLKIGLGCPRPGVEGFCKPMSFDGGHNALPSGHTVEITGAALPLALYAGGLLLPLALGVFVALMLYSRVFLGWHSPADVAFGLGFGLFAGALIHSYGRSS